MSAPRIVGKNYTDAIRFARETLGLHPNTVRVVSRAGGLSGYGYTLHLAPGWKKNPAYHSINSRLRFKRGIEIIDHSAEVQKEQARKVEDAPEPPEGWFTFGTHAMDMLSDDTAHPLEFSTEVGDDGLPLWERPASEWINVPVAPLAETDDNPVEMRHCEGCGEDYNAFEESHVGHKTQTAVNTTGKPEVTAPPDFFKETDAETGTKEPGEDAEGAEEQPRRRRRRCKVCGILVEPDDVEAHAAEHEAE